jgi:endoglucanase
VLIGSGTWSQDVDVAAADPVKGKNLAYTFHFYAGTHGQPLRDKVESATNRGVAVFSSEWGTSKATGGEGFFLRESEEWLSFLDRHAIGWVNFSLSDKADSSSALKNLHDALTQGLTKLLDRQSLMVPETPGPAGYPIWAADELTPSGTFVRNKMRNR